MKFSDSIDVLSTVAYVTLKGFISRLPFISYNYFSLLRESWKFVYRVEKRILPVKFFLNIYSMLQDINLKIDTDNPQVLSYDYFKA